MSGSSRGRKKLLVVLLVGFWLAGCSVKPRCPHFFVYADDTQYLVEHVSSYGYQVVGTFKTLPEAVQASEAMNKAANTKCEERP